MFTHLDDPMPAPLPDRRRLAISEGVRRGRRRRRVGLGVLVVAMVVVVAGTAAALVGANRPEPVTRTGGGTGTTASTGQVTTTTGRATGEVPLVSRQEAFAQLRNRGGIVYANGADLVLADDTGRPILRFANPVHDIRCDACEEVTLSPDRTALALVDANSAQALAPNPLVVVTATATTTLPGTERASHPAWAPDSRNLAFDAPANNPDTISVIDRTGAGLHALGSGRDPAWSADGTHLFFDRVTEPARIMRMDADGAHVVQITRTTSEQVRPSPSPDGRYLAFYDGASDGISISDVDGTHVRTLVSCQADACNGGFADEPRWSPDSTQVAYLVTLPTQVPTTSSSPAGGTELWLVASGGGTPRHVATVGEPVCLSWR